MARPTSVRDHATQLAGLLSLWAIDACFLVLWAVLNHFVGFVIHLLSKQPAEWRWAQLTIAWSGFGTLAIYIGLDLRFTWQQLRERWR